MHAHTSACAGSTRVRDFTAPHALRRPAAPRLAPHVCVCVCVCLDRYRYR